MGHNHTQNQQQYSLLFVEDSLADINFTVSYLEKRLQIDLQYVQVEESIALLDDVLTQHTFDLVFCDFKLPNFTAADAIKRIKSTHPTLPIILFSGQITVEQAVDMMRVGADVYVDKSDHKRLIEIVQEELDIMRQAKYTQELEDNLQQLKTYYQSIVDHQHEFICRFDSEFTITFANHAYCEWKGFSPNQLLGKSYFEGVNEEDRHQITQKIQSLSQEMPSETTIYQTQSPDGKNLWFEWTDIAIFNDAGDITEYQAVGRDITSLKSTQQQLENTQQELAFKSQNLQSILATMQDVILSISLQDRSLIYISSSFEEIYGYGIDEFFADPDFFKKVVHPDDLEESLQAQQRCLRDGFAEFEHRIYHYDGSIRWIHRRAWVIYDDAGNPQAINDSSRDITEQKLAEQAMRESEELYRLTLTNISDAVFITDNNGDFTFVCPNVYILYQYDRQEVIEAGHISFVLGDSLLFNRDDLIQVGEITNIEHQVTTKLGDIRDVLVNVKHIEIGKGTTLYTVHDITERKQAEQLIEQSKNRLNSYFNNSAQGILIVDLNGIIVDLNTRISTLFGYEKHELYQKPFDMLMPESTRQIHQRHFDHYIRNPFTRPMGNMLNVTAYTRDGEEFLIEIGLTYLSNQQQIMVLISDISERRRAELALRQSEEYLRALIQSQTNYIIRIDLNGKHTYWNQKFEDEYGWMYGNKIAEADALTSICDYHHERTRETVEKCLANPDKIFQVELDKPTQQGIRTTLWEFSCLTDSDNQPKEIQCIGIDITDRVQALRELDLSKQRYQMISDVSVGYAYIANIDEQLNVQIEWSTGDVSRLFGLTETRQESVDISEFMYAADLEQSDADLHEALTTGRQKTSVYRYHYQEMIFWLEVERKPIWDETLNRVTKLISYARDVTTQKQTEEALAHSEARYRSLIESSESEIVMIDYEGNFLYANQIFLNKLGRSQGDIIGANMSDLFGEETVAKRLAQIHQVIDTGEGLIYEDKGVTDQRWYRASIQPVRNTDGEINAVLINSVDITDRRLAEQKLFETNQRYESLLESTDAEVIMVSRDGVMLYANHNYARNLGRDLDDLLNKNIRDLFPPSTTERYLAVMQQVLQTEEGIIYEIKADNDEWARARVQPIRNVDGEIYGFTVLSFNITDQKRAQQIIIDNEHRFRIISELLSDSATEYTIAPDGSSKKVWHIGNTDATTLGYPENYLETSNDRRKLTHPDDLAMLDESLQRTKAGERTENTYRMLAADGTYRWFTIKRQPVWDEEEQRVVSYILAKSDITDQKRAQQIIIDNEQRFRIISELLSDTAKEFIVEPDGEIKNVWSIGTATDVALGYPAGYFQDAPNLDKVQQHIHPDDVEILRQGIERTLAGERTTDTYRVKAADDTYHWYVVSRQPTWDEAQQRVVSYMIATSNITAQKEAEEALRTSEQRSRMVSELMADTALIYEADEEGNTIGTVWQLGLAIEKALGYPSGYFDSAQRRRQLVHPDDLETVLEHKARTLAGEHTSTTYRMISADGQYRWYSVQRQPIWDEKQQRYSQYILTSKDITAQKEAEEALRTSEQRSRMVSELMADTAVIFDVDEEHQVYKTVWQLGASMDKNLGYPEGTLDTVELRHQIMHPDDLPTIIELRARTLQGEYTSNDYRILAADGKYRWYNMQRKPIWDEKQQRYSQYILTAKDITAQKEAEITLRENEAKLSALISSQTSYVVRTDMYGNYTYCNDTFRRDHDWLHDGNLIGQSALDTIQPYHHDRVYATVMGCLAQPGKILQVELDKVAADGKPAPTLWDFVCITDADGNPSEIQSMGIDISEIKESQRQLTEANERYSSLIESMDSLVIMLDADGKFLYANLKYVEHLGSTMDEVLNHSLHDIYGTQEAERQIKNIRQVMTSGEGLRYDVEIAPPDGKKRWYHVSMQPVKDSEDNIFAVLVNSIDIHELKETQENLFEANERYSSLIESTDAFIMLVNYDGTIEYVNRPAAAMTGLTPDGIIGTNVLDLFPPDSAKRQMEVVQAVIDQGEGVVYETLNSVTGEPRWYRASLQPVRNSSGQITAVLVNSVDIHKRKISEKMLQANEQKLQTLINSQTTYVLRTDLQGYYTYWNNKYLEEFGFLHDDKPLKESHALETICEYHHQRATETVNRCITNPGEVYQVELDKPKKDGGVLTTLWEFICLTDDKGKPTEMQCMGIDITDRRHAENQLRASEKRYRQMFELHGLPKLIVDPQTARIVDANPSAAMFYGYSLDEIKTKTMYDLSHNSAEEVREKMRRAASTEMMSCNFSHHTRLNGIREVEIFTGPIEVEGEMMFYSIITDITEKEQVKAELEKSAELLEKRVVERTLELENTKNQLEVIFNSSTLGILLYDLEKGFIQANFACDWLFGKPFEAYNDCDLTELIADDSIEKVAELLTSVKQQGTSQSIEITAKRLNSEFDAEMSISPIVSSAEENQQMVITINDITDRKRVQHAIAEERNLLRTVIDAVPEFIYVKDTEHRMLLNNIAHARSIGCDNPQEAVGKTDFELFPEALAQGFYADEQRLLETRQAVVNIEERSIGVDGQEIWALTSKVPLFNLDGELRGLVGITRDITAMKEKEEALRRSEQQLRESENMLQLIINTIPVRVFWKDRDCIYRGGNQLLVDDTRYSHLDDIIGKSNKDLFPHDWEVYEADDRSVMESGISKLNFEEPQNRPNGEEVWLQTSKVPLRNADNEIIGVMGIYSDITERKRAEEQLRYLANLQGQMQDAVIAIDLDYNVRSWNRGAEQLYGWSRDEVMGKSLENFTRTEYIDDSNHEETYQQLMRDKSWQGEVIQYHKDGTPINILASGVLMTDQEGRPTGMLAVNHDYTERKKAQEQIAVSEARYRLLAENVSDLITRHHGKEILTYVTPSAYKLTGYTHEELTGTSIYDLIHPDDARKVKDIHFDLNDLNNTMTFDYRIVRKDGGIRWFETTSQVLFNKETGRFTEVIAVSRDVTERKETESALQELSERLRLATEAAEIGVWDWNVQEDKLVWDKQMYKIYGIPYVSDSQVEHLKIWEKALHPDDYDSATTTLQDTVNKHDQLNNEFRIILPSGQVRYLQAYASVYRDKDGIANRMVGVNLDVTEIKEAEHALISALEKEKELGELKSRFVSMASHEFRTPLAGIMATTETLSIYRHKMNEEQINYRLDKIRQQVNHMKNMMDDVLRLARMQSGRLSFNPDNNNLDELILNLIEEFNAQSDYQDRIEYICQIDTPVVFWFDLQLMRHILNNFIHNALKYSANDQLVHVTLTKENDMIKCRIEDQGIGIPESDLKHLFEPFHRANNVGTISGTGLGLSIAQQAVESHRGTIEVDSQVDRGTTFILTFPTNEG